MLDIFCDETCTTSAVAHGETDAVSLKRKVTTLRAMKARFAAETPLAIRSGSPSARGPGGRFEISAGPNGALVVTRPGLPPTTSSPFEADGADVVLADDGTTLCVRTDAGWRVGYSTFDLDRRAVLQRFDDVVGSPPPSPGCPGPRSERK